MEEEKLKHEIAYLHRQIRGLWREAPEHTFDHIKEYTRKNAFLDYNFCNNKACLSNKDVNWFAKIYYCSSECECQARQQKEALKRMEAEKVAMKQRYHQARQKRKLERKREEKEEREEKRRKGREERIDKALEEERKRQEKEKKQEELEQKEARERQRREETRRQKEMQREGKCEKGYAWVNRGNGYYQCSGGSHWYHFETTSISTKLHNLNLH